MLATEAPDPALCTETVSPDATIGTFDLRIRESGSATDFLLGNITVGGIQVVPNVVERRSGKDNSLLDLLRIGTDYFINFTCDAITIRNLALIFNESLTSVAGGCEFPLKGDKCVRTYGVLLTHDFPCDGDTLQVEMWRAAFLQDTTVNFDATTNANFAGQFRALKCESNHPTQPFGRVFVSSACPIS